MRTSTIAVADRPRASRSRPGRLGGRRAGRGLRAGWGTYAVLTVVAAGSVFPFYWMFVVASNDNSAMAQLPPTVVPGGNLLTNVERVLESIPFFTAMLNTAIVAGTITISVVFFSTLAGFAFAKLDFRGRGVLLAVVVATIAVPQQLGLIPLYILMAKFGWVNELKAVIVPSLVTALGVFWMRQFISTAVPDDLIDAARVDGCSSLRVIWHVVAPAVRPAAGVLGLITFLYAWNDFLWPLVVLQDPAKQTIQLALQQLNDAYVQDYSLSLAGTLMATVPMLVVFLVFARQIIAGLMEGSVKG